MSIGGKVYCKFKHVKTIDIVVQDGPPYNNLMSVEVVRNVDSEQIKPGDSLWWHGGTVLWTPQDRSRTDVPIRRVGYVRGVPEEAAA